MIPIILKMSPSGSEIFFNCDQKFELYPYNFLINGLNIVLSVGMELVGGKWLTISGVSYMFPVPLSYITIAGIAYISHGWRTLQLAITLPSFLFLGMWW